MLLKIKKNLLFIFLFVLITPLFAQIYSNEIIIKDIKQIKSKETVSLVFYFRPIAKFHKIEFVILNDKNEDIFNNLIDKTELALNIPEGFYTIKARYINSVSNEKSDWQTSTYFSFNNEILNDKQAEDKLQKLNFKINTLTYINETNNKTIAELTQKTNEMLKESTEKFSKELAKLENDNIRITEDLNAKIFELENLKNELNTFERQKKNLMAEIESRDIIILNNETELEKFKERIINITELEKEKLLMQLVAGNEIILEKDEELAKLNERINSAESEKTELAAELAAANKIILAKNEELQNLEDHINNSKYEKEKTETELAAASKTIIAKDAELAKLNERINSAESEKIELAAELAAANKIIIAKNEELQNIEASINNTKKEKEKLIIQLAAADKIIAANNIEFEKLKNELKLSEAQKNNIALEIKELQKQLQLKIQENNDYFLTHKKESEKTIKNYEDRIKDLERQRDTIIKGKYEENLKVSKLESDVAKLKSENFNLFNELNEFKQKELNYLIEESNRMFTENNLPGALEKLSAAQKLNIESEILHYNIAAITYKTGDYKTALFNIDNALKINPSNINNKIYKLLILIKLNQFEETKKFVQSLAASDLQNSEIIKILKKTGIY